MNLLISSAANQRPAVPRTYIFVNKNLFYKFSAYFLISPDTAVNLTAKSQIPVTGFHDRFIEMHHMRFPAPGMKPVKINLLTACLHITDKIT